MNKKLYVGNLSSSANSAELTQLFAQYGGVHSAKVAPDGTTGRSKGFGFVEMSTEMEAQAAIAGLNGHEHDGRSLIVRVARIRPAP